MFVLSLPRHKAHQKPTMNSAVTFQEMVTIIHILTFTLLFMAAATTKTKQWQLFALSAVSLSTNWGPIVFSILVMTPTLIFAGVVSFYIYKKIKSRVSSFLPKSEPPPRDPRFEELSTSGYHPALGLTAHDLFPEVSRYEDIKKYLDYRDLWFSEEACFTTPPPPLNATKEELQIFCLNMWLELHFWVLFVTHPQYGVKQSAWKYKTAFDNNVPDRIRRLNQSFLKELALNNKEAVRAAYARYKTKAS